MTSSMTAHTALHAPGYTSHSLVPWEDVAYAMNMFELHQLVHYNNQCVLLSPDRGRYVVNMLSSQGNSNQTFDFFTYLFTKFAYWKYAHGLPKYFIDSFRTCFGGGEKLVISTYHMQCIYEHMQWEKQFSYVFED